MAASSSDALSDKAEINDVLLTWGQARDRGEWDTLRACFQPDATIHIAWISDTAEEFVRRSADMLAEWKEGESSKHFGASSTIYSSAAKMACGGYSNERWFTRRTVSTRSSPVGCRMTILTRQLWNPIPIRSGFWPGGFRSPAGNLSTTSYWREPTAKPA